VWALHFSVYQLELKGKAGKNKRKQDVWAWQTPWHPVLLYFSLCVSVCACVNLNNLNAKFKRIHVFNIWISHPPATTTPPFARDPVYQYLFFGSCFMFTLFLSRLFLSIWVLLELTLNWNWSTQRKRKLPVQCNLNLFRVFFAGF